MYSKVFVAASSMKGRDNAIGLGLERLQWRREGIDQLQNRDNTARAKLMKMKRLGATTVAECVGSKIEESYLTRGLLT